MVLSEGMTTSHACAPRIEERSPVSSQVDASVNEANRAYRSLSSEAEPARSTAELLVHVDGAIPSSDSWTVLVDAVESRPL